MTGRCKACGRNCWIGAEVIVGPGICYELVDTFGKREIELAALVLLKAFRRSQASAVTINRATLSQTEARGLDVLLGAGLVVAGVPDGARLEPSAEFWERVGLTRVAQKKCRTRGRPD